MFLCEHGVLSNHLIKEPWSGDALLLWYRELTNIQRLDGLLQKQDGQPKLLLKYLTLREKLTV